MDYAPILTLTLSHAYYGGGRPPVSVVPEGARGFDRAGLLMRRIGGRSVVLADNAQERPEALALVLEAETPEVLAVTRGADWTRMPRFAFGLGQDDVVYDEVPVAAEAARGMSRRLAVLDVALPEAGAREITLRFGAVGALWAYVVLGAERDAALEVVDPAGAIAFEDLGARDLPDGTPARVLRSAAPIEARARPTEKFALQRPGPFGPETVISVLPAAGTGFRPSDEPGDGARLQSDIYVTLW